LIEDSYIAALTLGIERFELGRDRSSSVQILEDVDIALRSGKSPGKISNGSQTSQDESSNTQNSSPQVGKTVDNTETASAHAMIGEIGYLPHIAMAELGRSHVPRHPQRIDVEMTIMAALGVDALDASKVVSLPLGLLMADGAGGHGISLQREGAEPYIQRFIDEVVWQYPYLEAKQIVHDFEACLCLGASAARPQPIGALTSFNTFIFMAIGMLLSPEAGRLAFTIQKLHSTALSLLPVVI
jgi:hypothetical protein